MREMNGINRVNVTKDFLDYKKYKTLSPLPEECKLQFEKNIDSVQKDWKKPGLDAAREEGYT